MHYPSVAAAQRCAMNPSCSRPRWPLVVTIILIMQSSVIFPTATMNTEAHTKLLTDQLAIYCIPPAGADSHGDDADMAGVEAQVPLDATNFELHHHLQNGPAMYKNSNSSIATKTIHKGILTLLKYLTALNMALTLRQPVAVHETITLQSESYMKCPLLSTLHRDVTPTKLISTLCLGTWP